jgi:sensor histidine kinase YesM
MLAHLADLLREVLRQGDKRETSLREELRVLEAYLEISRKRFGDRLTIAIEAAPETLDLTVPFFVLQPLVENALHHGVGARSGPATITIRASVTGGHLELAVSDDGPGADGDIRRGIGLTNTEARLAGLYGSGSSMTIGSGERGGFSVRLAIPIRS